MQLRKAIQLDREDMSQFVENTMEHESTWDDICNLPLEVLHVVMELLENVGIFHSSSLILTFHC